MSAGDVRKGIAQSKINEQGMVVLSIDAAIFGIFTWRYTDLWALGVVGFVIAIIVLMAIASNQQMSAWMSVLGSLAWGAIAFYICSYAEMSVGNTLVLTVIAGALSAGWHMLGFQHMADIQQPSKSI